ncbi:hypothetical protein [Arachidicoccus sp.]|jgi:hypothetical protein|uniref:hypothetical protein n=1 Tax=Arachidicoccus sp. TaxID=1872624 RepID=UPI003D1E461D
MRLLKLALFSIVTLFLLITGIGLLFPPEVTVMRSSTFIAPKDSVYALLSDMRRWPEWLFDSTHSLKILTKNSSGKGATAEVGYNKITIVNAQPGVIQTIWKAPKANDQVCEFQISSNGRAPGVHVMWYFRQHLNWYPWDRIGAVLNEKILGPSMDSSFAHLQKRLQQ